MGVGGCGYMCIYVRVSMCVYMYVCVCVSVLLLTYFNLMLLQSKADVSFRFNVFPSIAFASSFVFHQMRFAQRIFFFSWLLFEYQCSSERHVFLLSQASGKCGAA